MSRALPEPFHREMSLRPHSNEFLAVLVFAVAIALAAIGMTRGTRAAVPNTVAQWDKIAEDAVVRSGAFQNEGLIYMAYVSAAVYNAVVAIEGGYQPYGQGVSAPVGASTDAAVIEATYRSLVNYFPTQAPLLDPLYETALAAILDGQSKTDGQWVGEGRREPDHHHADVRRTDDADRDDVPLPHQESGSGCLASDTAGIRRAANAMGRQRDALRASGRRPVPAGRTAFAAERRLGRGFQ
jgi:hypothetical protein